MKSGLKSARRWRMILAAVLCVAAVEVFALRYDVDLDFFRQGSHVSHYYGTVEKVEWKDARALTVYAPRRTFDICYDIRPKLKPVFGMEELVLESESSDAEWVELSLMEFPKGRRFRFREKWAPVIVFKAALDPEKRYQIRKIGVTCKARTSLHDKMRAITFKTLSARYDTKASQALCVDVDTGNAFHCVRDALKETPRLRVRNVAQEAVTVQGRLSLESSLGETRAFDVPSLTIEGNGTKWLALPKTSAKGVWYVKGALFAGDGSTNTVETRFARIDCHRCTPPVPRGTFRMGINYHMVYYSREDREKTLAALVASGAKLARVGLGLSMNNVQKNGPDDWDWGESGEMLDRLDAAGIRASTGPGVMPKWSVRPEATAKAKALKDWRWEALSLPRERLFERFCEKMAQRFKGRLDYYEIGNEWDLNFRHPVSEAVEIQREAYRGIKRVDPEVCVLPNGWAGANDLRATRNTPRANFQKEFLLLSKGDCYDVHPTHCHGDFKSYEKRIESFLQLRRETGTDFRPWFSNESAISSWRGEREPAATVWKKIVFARAHGSVDYIWYNLRGTGWDPKDPEQGYGLLTADYLPRETFVAFAALSTVLKDQPFRGVVVRKQTRHVYAFARSGAMTLIGWDDAFKENVAHVCVRTDAPKAEWIDLFGNRRAVAVLNGTVDFELGALPRALALEGGTWARLGGGPVLSENRTWGLRVTDIPGVGETQVPQFVLSDPSQVTDFFEAIPGQEHRLWRGKDDLSAEIRLERDEKALIVTVAVRDDQYVPTAGELDERGDFLRGTLSADETTAGIKLNFGRPKPRGGNVMCYEARMAWEELGRTPPESIGLTVQIEDDDGEGRECALILNAGT